MKHLKDYQLLIGLSFIAIAILVSGLVISHKLDEGCTGIYCAIASLGSIIGGIK